MTLFITGTDTDVGKTVVTAFLAAVAQSLNLSVAVYKPIQTGASSMPPSGRTCGLTHQPVTGDCDTVNQILETPVDTYNTYCFAPPVTPAVADVDRIINLNLIKTTYDDLCQRYDVVLVEGAGGVHVPVTVTPKAKIIDLFSVLNCPTVVVARPNLGTINHTLLTVEALLSRNIDVHGVFVSGYPTQSDDLAIQTLPQMFDAFLPVPVLAYLPPFKPLQFSVYSPVVQTTQGALNSLFIR